jgi:hypothetical protein
MTWDHELVMAGKTLVSYSTTILQISGVDEMYCPVTVG